MAHHPKGAQSAFLGVRAPLPVPGAPPKAKGQQRRTPTIQTTARRFRMAIWPSGVALGSLAAVTAAWAGQPDVRTVAPEGGSSVSSQAPEATGRQVSGHNGPAVAEAPFGKAGPARFVGKIHDRFNVAAALQDTVAIDAVYRTPASPHYDRCVDLLKTRLARAGFGRLPGFTLRVIETEQPSPAWWPEAGMLEMIESGKRELLLGFAAPGDAHRTLIPMGGMSGDVEGPLTLSTKDAPEGSILVTRAPLSAQIVQRAAAAKIACVLSASVFAFTKDPSGGDRHLDAIQFTRAPSGATIPVGQISLRVLERIESAPAGTRLRFYARTRTEQRPLRTLVAEIVGTTRAGDAVAIASHLQEPGAGDNAAGAAGLCAAAVATLEAIQAKEMARPARTLTFVFGNEMQQSSIWLDQESRTTVAALSADMLGQSPERTGAIALLERTPDPGALYTILPDAHTPWGAGAVKAKDLIPNGVNVICREAMLDVAEHVGGWRTSENPWEGGSDHDVFNRKGIPAALMWHFTDFTYHTSLDRMEMIDGTELRRTCAAIVGAGLALADARKDDLARHLASNALELDLRVEAATNAKNEAAVAAWRAWSEGTDAWLRNYTSQVD